MDIKKVSDDIPGYNYGAASLPTSPVTSSELDELKTTVGMTADDEDFLRLAGEVLAEQTEQIVTYWRSNIIAKIPNGVVPIFETSG